jgi:translation initiation factor IF-1
MVKNTQGGSSHKKFGRKFTTGAKNNKLRLSEDEGEIYSIVTKMLGNGMFHCIGIDEEHRLGYIRGKFSGRGKRDNMVDVGKWVLIGLREWDINSSRGEKEKLQKCDLLEVYSDSDKERLKESVAENWNLLEANDLSRINKSDFIEEDDSFQFITDKDLEREKLILEMKEETSKKIIFTSFESEEEEINIDDI